MFQAKSRQQQEFDSYLKDYRRVIAEYTSAEPTGDLPRSEIVDVLGTNLADYMRIRDDLTPGQRGELDGVSAKALLRALELSYDDLRTIVDSANMSLDAETARRRGTNNLLAIGQLLSGRYTELPSRCFAEGYETLLKPLVFRFQQEIDSRVRYDTATNATLEDFQLSKTLVRLGAIRSELSEEIGTRAYNLALKDVGFYSSAVESKRNERGCPAYDIDLIREHVALARSVGEELAYSSDRILTDLQKALRTNCPVAE